MRALRRFRLAAAAAALSLSVAALAGACGGARPEPPPAAGPDAPGAPALLKRELGPGEVLVEGEASPVRDGPFELSGRYRAAFAQYAPERPGRGFGDAVPFVAELWPAGRPEPGERPIRLFEAAARAGTRTVELDGTYFVEVAFGDFPFALRLTPLDSER